MNSDIRSWFPTLLFVSAVALFPGFVSAQEQPVDRANLLNTVAAQAADHGPGPDKDWAQRVRSLSGQRIGRELVRIFKAGEEAPAIAPLPSPIERITLDEQIDGSLVADVFVGQEPAVEHTRVFLVEDRAYVVRDVYIGQGFAAATSGMDIPLLLESSKAVAPPFFTAISGISDGVSVVNGKLQLDIGPKYNGYRAIPTTWSGSTTTDGRNYPWTITGFNFGSSGSLVLTTTAAGTAKVVSISSWTDTKIVAYFSLPYTATASITTLKITNSAGVSATFAVGSTAPLIRTRAFRQCTHEVAYQRIKLGKQPSPTAYGNRTTITTSWIPAVGDQLYWDTSHTAIVLSVSVSSPSGGYKRYTLGIREANYDGQNSVASSTTYFELRTVNGVTTITKKPRSRAYATRDATAFYH